MILAQVEHKDSAQDAHPYGTLGQLVAQLHAREHEPAKPSVLSGARVEEATAAAARAAVAKVEEASVAAARAARWR